MTIKLYSLSTTTKTYYTIISNFLFHGLLLANVIGSGFFFHVR